MTMGRAKGMFDMQNMTWEIKVGGGVGAGVWLVLSSVIRGRRNERAQEYKSIRGSFVSAPVQRLSNAHADPSTPHQHRRDLATLRCSCRAATGLARSRSSLSAGFMPRTRTNRFRNGTTAPSGLGRATWRGRERRLAVWLRLEYGGVGPHRRATILIEASLDTSRTNLTWRTATPPP